MAKNQDIYSVTRLNREVRSVLEGSFPILWVKGEISNFACPASGHWYFSLKDAHSQVRCAMFRGRNRLLKFQPENGDEVLVRANAGLYEGRGEFQLIVEQMEPSGEGALQKAFEQLKQKLFKEGLFGDEHKKPLPRYPHHIGVVTSPSGAAIRDILTVLKRRYPLAEVIIYPVPVQGDSAANDICNMLDTVAKRNEVDVIILARGGGSMEDLWAFNDEQLVRKIHAISIPVVSGVGHEIDFTIADFVADYRAATPSAAAEVICTDISYSKQFIRESLYNLLAVQKRNLSVNRENLKFVNSRLQHPSARLREASQRLDNLSMRFSNIMNSQISLSRYRLDQVNIKVASGNLGNRILNYSNRSGQLGQKLEHTLGLHLERSRNQLQNLSNQIRMNNPKTVLNKGYSITSDLQTGDIIKNSKQVKTDQLLKITLGSGTLNCRVIKQD